MNNQSLVHLSRSLSYQDRHLIQNGKLALPPHSKNDDKVKFSTRQLLILFSYMYGNFFLAACVSLQAPFFPREAEKKGANPTEYGFVFGVYEIAIMLVSPIVGKLVASCAPSILIRVGLLTTGLATIGFGFIDKFESGKTFLVAAYLIRIIEGVGASTYLTPSYTSTATEFPNDQARVLPFLETAFATGLIFGPTIGSWLFAAGGFYLPFTILGICMVFGVLIDCVSWFSKVPSATSSLACYTQIINDNYTGTQQQTEYVGARPRSHSQLSHRSAKFLQQQQQVHTILEEEDNQRQNRQREEEEEEEERLKQQIVQQQQQYQQQVCDEQGEQKVEYLKILFSAGISVYALAITSSLTLIGFNAATLEPHLRQFDLSVILVGSLFVINGIIYALTSPFANYICQKFNINSLLIFGTLTTFLGIALIGPLPLLPFQPKLFMIIIALVLLGIGNSFKLLASLVGTFKYAVNDLGMPDNKATFGVCSSIYHSATSLGALIGPTIGGYLLDNFGYRHATYALLILELILFVLIIKLSMKTRFRNQ